MLERCDAMQWRKIHRSCDGHVRANRNKCSLPHFDMFGLLPYHVSVDIRSRYCRAVLSMGMCALSDRMEFILTCARDASSSSRARRQCILIDTHTHIPQKCIFLCGFKLIHVYPLKSSRFIIDFACGFVCYVFIYIFRSSSRDFFSFFFSLCVWPKNRIKRIKENINK